MHLNILVLSYLFPNKSQPGYGIFVLNRIKAVSQYCNVKVIAPIQWYPLIQLLKREAQTTLVPSQDTIADIDVSHPRFFVIPRYLKWIDAITFYWAARKAIRQLILKDNFYFDLVDVHWTYPDIVAGYFLAKKAGKKFMVTVRGHEALYQEEISIRRWLVSYFLRQADQIVALSAELQDKIIKLGVHPDRVKVILNGVDLSNFYPLDRAACRSQLGLPADKKMILSVGRLTEGKGHQELIRALFELSKSHQITLYIIGGTNPEEDYSQVLKNLISELQLKNVFLLDKVAHELLPLWYNAADLFCLISKREGCPNVLLEALACGTPAIVTDVGAVERLIKSGENGFLIQPQDIPSLPQIISTALAHDWHREAIANRMKAWSWSECAQQVVETYQSLVNYRDS